MTKRLWPKFLSSWLFGSWPFLVVWNKSGVILIIVFEDFFFFAQVHFSVSKSTMVGILLCCKAGIRKVFFYSLSSRNSSSLTGGLHTLRNGPIPKGQYRRVERSRATLQHRPGSSYWRAGSVPSTSLCFW
jgi:hypothetical protein